MTTPHAFAAASKAGETLVFAAAKKYLNFFLTPPGKFSAIGPVMHFAPSLPGNASALRALVRPIDRLLNGSDMSSSFPSLTNQNQLR